MSHEFYWWNFHRNFTCNLWRCNWRFKGLSDFVCLESVIYITKQEKVSIYCLCPFLGEFVRAKRKPNFGNVIGQRKNSPRKSCISSYSFTCRFAGTNSPSGKRHSSDLPITYDVIDVNEFFHDFMLVNRAQPPPHPPASVNLVLQHGAKPCKVSIALFVDYSYYSSTIRGPFAHYSYYSPTIRTIRRLFADYSYYSSTIRTIRTIRFTILVLSITTFIAYLHWYLAICQNDPWLMNQ
jgi:hypothetical protein